MFTRSTALRLGLPVFVALLAGCASFAPSAYLNSSALSEIDTSRGFCVHEPSLDPKRINGSKTIQRMFGEAGFDSSCGAQAYVVEWWFESTDQRVDHSHMPTFCSGYGYWRTCTIGQGATLITYQRTFQLVVREDITNQSFEAGDTETEAAVTDSPGWRGLVSAPRQQGFQDRLPVAHTQSDAADLGQSGARSSK